MRTSFCPQSLTRKGVGKPGARRFNPHGLRLPDGKKKKVKEKKVQIGKDRNTTGKQEGGNAVKEKYSEKRGKRILALSFR